MRFKIVFLLIFSNCILAGEKTSVENSELMIDLYKALEDVSQKHDIDIASVANLVPDITVDQNMIGCGTGIRLALGNDKYITNISTSNQISAGTKRPTLDDKQWNGKGLDVSELVILEKGKVKSTIELDTHRRELEFILFEPKKVSFFEWKDIDASYHSRSCFSY